MAAILDGAAYGPPGEDSPAALTMRQSLAETGVTAQHCHDVLQAFRLDAEGKKAATVMAYAEMLSCGVTTVADLSARHQRMTPGPVLISPETLLSRAR